MIELIPEPLPDALEAKLRSWLTKPEALLLRRVAAAKCQFKQADALAQASASTNPDDRHNLLHHQAMKDAVRYTTFLSVLDEFVTQPKSESFQTAKLKPTNAITTHDSEPTGEG